MKNLIYIFILMLSAVPGFSQAETDVDSTGLPGDQFSLEGALDMFRLASSPEEFEKLLNMQEKHVHNLDLNGDGEVDYIRVNAVMDGNTHIFVLQVPVSKNDNQDIAVIQVEKTADDKAVAQIVGDADIFGEETIVEPSEGMEQQMDGQGKGPNHNHSIGQVLVVNVWSWPCVKFIYAPAYRPWISPWYFGYYPRGWKPWRPLGWAVWRPFRARTFYPAYRVTTVHRAVRARSIYKPMRVTSKSVYKRHAFSHERYKVSRTKTTVKTSRGGKVTKKTTTVKTQRRN